MSQAQEERRRRLWENGGEEAFEPVFDRLRSLKKEVEELPEGSCEREAKQKEYNLEYESAFKAYDKATDF